MRLIQLIGDGIEELYYFPDDIEDDEIIALYKKWEWFTSEESLKEEGEYSDFEDYLAVTTPEMKVERVFVDEIYV